MFEFMFIVGLFLAFYGYSVMKNPNVWGEQGKNSIKPENWKGYIRRNGQFMMYAGFLFAALAALDIIFDFATWLFILLLIGGLLLLIYPLCHWMHQKEGTWNPWPHHETEKQKRKREAREAEKRGTKK